MALFYFNKAIPTGIDDNSQSQFNIAVAGVIIRILNAALNQNEIQALIDASFNAAPTLIDNTDSPYAIQVDDKNIEVDTTSGAVTLEVQDNTVVNPGFTCKITRTAGANDVTIDYTTNSCTKNGVASNTTISASYAPKRITLLGTTANDYLEE